MTVRTFFCALCDVLIEHDADADSVAEGIASALEHFRTVHPDEFQDIQTWPDGSPVVLDDSLEPEDFIDGDGA